MAEEKKSIFRKESLDRISTPEELDNYLQVTTPGTWMSMGAVIVLLIGVCIWAVFGHLSTKMNVAVVASNGSAVCYMPVSKAEHLKEGMKVDILDQSYAVADSGLAPILIDGSTDISIRIAGTLNEGEFVCPWKVDGELADGVYAGEVVVETVSPISFILN